MNSIRRTLLLWLAPIGVACAQTPLLAMPVVYMAIWPFDVVAVGHSVNSEETNFVRDLLPDLLAAELVASPRIRLVERQRLDQVLKEQEIGTSQLADEAARLRLGRLSGARWMLFGNHLRIGTIWQFDARLVDVETSRVETSFTENGQHSDYQALPRRIASHLIKVSVPIQN